MDRPRLRAVLLTAVLAIGFGLRLWYATEPRPFPDEKYALRNVASVLDHRHLEPANVYYPSPVFFLPPTVLVATFEWLRDSGAMTLPATRDELGWTSFGLFLCRLVQVVFGTVTLYLTYLLGVTLFSVRAAWIGALAVAFMPLHIRASAYFKPDAQVTLTVLIAFLLALRALRRDRPADYALAGGAVALAMSGKLLGALIAPPLAAAVLLRAGRPLRQRASRLALATGVAAGLFVLLNPYWLSYPGWLRGLRHDYARRVGAEVIGLVEIPTRLVRTTLGETGHGPWIGSLALFGLLWLPVESARSSPKSQRSLERWIFACFPLFFVVTFALITPYFKSNNFVAIVPFTALAAGVVIDRAWIRWAAGRTVSGPLRWVAVLALVAIIAVPGTVFTYRSRTPTTRELALQFVGRRMNERLGRVLFVEETSLPPVGWQGRTHRQRDPVAVVEVDRLTRMGSRRIAASDGWIFHRSRLDEPDGARYRELMSPRPTRSVRTFRPSPFRLRGPPLVAVGDRWQSLGPAEALARVGLTGEPLRVRLPLPGGSGAETATLSIELPAAALAANRSWRRQARVGDRLVPLHWVSLHRGTHRFASERFPWPTDSRLVVLHLDLPARIRGRSEAAIRFWRRRDR